MKFKFILLFILVCSSFLVVAQEEEEILDLGNLLGIEGNITASGVDYITKITSEKEETIVSFTEESSFLKMGNNTFENIQPSSEEQEAFVKLNKEGKIVEADFVTNEKGGIYNFLGEDIFVPANSKVLFDEKNGLVIEATDGSEFKEGDNLFDLKLIGENIKLPNGEILNSGELVYDSSGQAFLKGGKTAVIDNIEISSTDDLNIYFEDSFNPSKNLGESYFYSNEEKLIIHSLENEEINVEFMPGNKFFDLNTVEYDKNDKNELIKFKQEDAEDGWLKDEYGFKYKIVPDKKDLLKMKVSGGDMLEAKKRTKKEFLFIGKEKEMIPLIEHIHSETGETSIQSGRSEFILNDKLQLNRKTYNIGENEFSKIQQKKYQSVPFQLKSDSISNGKGYELRVGSNNQFAIISPDETGKRIVYNEEGIGIGNYREELQVIDQLRAKYHDRNIDFGLTEENEIQLFGDEIELRSKEYVEPSPHMVQIVDQWLEENPDAEIGSFLFTDKAYVTSFGALEDRIILGEEAFDPLSTFKEKNNDRNLGPLQILDHEYEHKQDYILRKKDEVKQRKIYNNPITDNWRSEAESEAINQIDKDKILFEDLKSFELSSEEISKKQKELEYKKKLLESDYEEFKSKYNYEGYSKEMINNFLESEEKDLKSTILVKEIISDCENFGGESCTPLLEKHGEEETIKYLKEMVYIEKESKYVYSYIEDKIHSNPSMMALQDFYDKIAEEKKDYLSNDEYFNEMWNDIINEIELEMDSFNERDRKNINFFLEKSEEGNLDLPALSMIAEKNPKIYANYKSIEEYISQKVGMPAVYSFKETPLGYIELSTTYKEESIFERRQKIQKGTSEQQKIYSQLTQLAFDSGKMSVEEFKQLMGEDYCKKKNCCDKKCVIYKLNCEGGC